MKDSFYLQTGVIGIDDQKVIERRSNKSDYILQIRKSPNSAYAISTNETERIHTP